MNAFIVVMVTATSKKEAEKLSKLLLKNKLAACVNIIPNITSFFSWKGKLQKATESLLIIKTKKSLFSELERTVKQNHSYTVPEIIAVPVLKGSRAYLDWVKSSTQKPYKCLNIKHL